MKRKSKSNKPKHVPERTCVACRSSRPKRELLRIVRLTEGGVVVDETGKRNGRGAYLCRRRSCWLQALKHRSLQRALRTTLNEDEVAALEAYAASLTEPDAAISDGASGSGHSTEEV